MAALWVTRPGLVSVEEYVQPAWRERGAVYVLELLEEKVEIQLVKAASCPVR